LWLTSVVLLRCHKRRTACSIILCTYLAIIADVRGWGSFNVGSGLLTIISYRRMPDGTETVIGAGSVVLALLAGVLNAVAGTVLWARTSARSG
jgi:hypothetical protein